ncbi:MAG: 16S rRNA (adenine(1518)-N(6)/adenine(1519)-N(6))-dimethyltransferase RsmA [Acidimicrobiia bacterium]|nr:16S rRNA (adenine(1518)-N(6)/adenine(1519)-N(6))-dimethyltransferase RsmA [Acidimicrobiia bacterium]
MADNGFQARSGIRQLLVDHDVRPRKAFGQNFLADPNIVRRIVSVAGLDARSDVVEIGPGTGALTVGLAAVAARVVAYEVDRSLEPVLTEALASVHNVEVRFADARRVRLSKALDAGPWTLVANLPYNVGTGIVLDVLQHDTNITRLVTMVQREVAERLVAGPGTKTYGIPSVVVGLHGEATIAFSVPPQVFEPPPNVDSAVVVIDRVDAPPLANTAIDLAPAAFGQRRKTLRRSLAGVVDDEGFDRAGIDPTDRPERLEPGAFVRLAAAMTAEMR